MNTRRYFAYGANLNRQGMLSRCPDAIPVAAAWLEDYQLSFNGVATVVAQIGARVPGALWTITQGCEMALDDFEGWPWLYRKTTVVIDGSEAMLYVMNASGHGSPGAYYEHVIRQGYRDWTLDETYLDRALEHCQVDHEV